LPKASCDVYLQGEKDIIRTQRRTSIGEYWYRDKKYERYRRCDGGRIGKGLDELIAEGIENPEPELDVELEKAIASTAEKIKRKVGRPRKIPEAPKEQKQTRPLTESETMELKSLKKRILELENRRNNGKPYTRRS
jgi:hypothetical protein